MLGLKSYIHETFGQRGQLHENAEAPAQIPHAQLYECSDCETVFIESTRVRCSRCRKGTLSPIE